MFIFFNKLVDIAKFPETMKSILKLYIKDNESIINFIIEIKE
jgi:hypothetical protein